MTSQQHAPRHRSATGQGFGREPHPSLPLPVIPAVPRPAPVIRPVARPDRPPAPARSRLERTLGVIVVVLAVLVAGLGVAGLAVSARSTSASAAPGVVGATSAPTASPFGQAFTYADGAALRVGVPTTFRPSRSAVGDVHPYAYAATVTVLNAGATALDPTTVRVVTTVDGRATEPVVDAAKGPGVPPAGIIPPGGSASWTVAFSSSTDGGPVVVDVDPGAERGHAVFAGAL